MCGLKRSYSHVAKDASSVTAGAQQTQKPSTRSQLDQITAALEASMRDLPNLRAAATPVYPQPHSYAPSAAGAANANAQSHHASAPAADAQHAPSKATLQKKLKRLETCLAQWPEEDADPERLELLVKILEVKKQLVGSKPVGAQLDAARAAAKRAGARLEEAEQAVKAASLIRDAAAMEVATLQHAMLALESQLSTNPDADAFSGLQTQVSAMIGELKLDEFTCPTHVVQAEEHVATLLEGLRQMLEHSAKAREAGGQPARRMVGKQPDPAAPEPATVPAAVRHVGKQPMKRTMKDFFPVSASKRNSSVRCSSVPPKVPRVDAATTLA